MATKGTKRPVTRALDLVRRTQFRNDLGGYVLPMEDRDELTAILHQIDASTGKPDTARRRARSKKPAKKARARR